MSDFDGLLSDLKQFEESVQNPGFDLRLDLAEIILKRLREKGWTQTKLATEINRAPSYVTRVVHSDANCTFDTAGRILFALGVKVKLVEVQHAARPTVSPTIIASTTASSTILKITESNG